VDGWRDACGWCTDGSIKVAGSCCPLSKKVPAMIGELKTAPKTESALQCCMSAGICCPTDSPQDLKVGAPCCKRKDGARGVQEAVELLLCLCREGRKGLGSGGFI